MPKNNIKCYIYTRVSTAIQVDGYSLDALPHGWENMKYEDFLVERRKLMAARIKEAFEQLRKNAG